jgi:hypothetical protein
LNTSTESQYHTIITQFSIWLELLFLIILYFMDIRAKLYGCAWWTSAHEECTQVLQSLGFSIGVVGSRGSHSAKVYILDEEQDRFDSEILNNTVVGYNRKFFFSKITQWGHPEYFVSYQRK